MQRTDQADVRSLLLFTFRRKNAPEHSRLSQRVFGAEVLEHGDRRRQEQAPARVLPRALSWPHTHAHAPAPRSPASRAPADTPAAPRSPRSQHLRLGSASPTCLSIASASHPYLRRPSPLPPRRCMLRSISRKKSLSFNHRHLNCFIYVLSYVAKLEDPQRGA